MNETRLRARLLIHLLRNAKACEASNIIDLSTRCGASVWATLDAARALERAGLIDASRLRLTLSGLALATAYANPRSPAAAGTRRPGRSLPRASRAA